MRWPAGTNVQVPFGLFLYKYSARIGNTGTNWVPVCVPIHRTCIIRVAYCLNEHLKHRSLPVSFYLSAQEEEETLAEDGCSRLPVRVRGMLSVGLLRSSTVLV